MCSIVPVEGMEIERLSYIFGSFARRRQSREIAASGNKRCSIGESPKISHDRSKSAPQTTKTNQPKPHQRTKSVCNASVADENKFKCQVCKGVLVEPRVLPCLHTFCSRCLEGLVAREDDSGSTGGLLTHTKSSGSYMYRVSLNKRIKVLLISGFRDIHLHNNSC